MGGFLSLILVEVIEKEKVEKEDKSVTNQKPSFYQS